ncbi:MAG: RNA polymerase sigma factor [Candidatus Kapaibacteriota bacterium]|jgi:RNA polymerase sigma-70 factor (ECF subfamily)
MQKNVIKNDSRDDITLINSFLEGNKHDFEVLWFRYNRLIYAYILKMVRNIDDVDDILQDTFIKAFSAIQTYNQSYPFPAWLYKIASNTCIDYFRRKRIRPIPIGGMTNIQTALNEVLPDKSIPIDVKIANSETKLELNKAIALLPDRYRECIQLRHFEELSYEEISQKMQLPLGTIKITLFRARKMLLSYLSSKDMSLHS